MKKKKKENYLFEVSGGRFIDSAVDININIDANETRRDVCNCAHTKT